MPLGLLLLLLAGLLVLALLATGRDDSLAEPVRDIRPLGLPEDGPVTAATLERVRFPVAFRGYRMSSVDELLDRLRAELAERETPPAPDSDAAVPAAAPVATPEIAQTESGAHAAEQA